MPKMSSVEILKLMAQPTLSVRVKAKVEELPMLIGQNYGKIADYLGELGEPGELMTDVPFVAYHNLDMENLDVEMGFAVSKALPARGDILPGVIPESKAIFCMYRGAYEGLEPVYNEMAQWIEQHGCKMAGPSYEYYYNSPEVPESELLTKIVMPIA